MSFIDRTLNYGRDVIAGFAKDALKGMESATVLDLGAGHGDDLRNIKQAAGKNTRISLCAIENYKVNQEELRAQGIQVSSINLERDPFPYETGSIDLVCANQVLEHMKDLAYIVSEVSRVLRPGGTFIIGVPNLASLHNRFLLLIGQQPTGIRTLGPHVRGYTYRDFKKFLETDGFFRVEAVKGSNFYPMPRQLAIPLSRLFPKASVSIFLKATRTDKPGTFIEIFNTRRFETNFYIGGGKTIFDK